MSADFFNTTIGEQVTLQRGFDITKKQQRPGNVPVVSSGGISSFHDEAMVKGPGVVLGRKGSLGTVFYINEDFWPHDTSLWVKDFKNNNSRFVYYFFSNIAEKLKKMDVGAANPTLNRNHVHPLPIKWTTRGNQDKIVRILSSLDDKIELNHKINQTLEQMAQAIFKSWFVDFEPVKAKIEAKKNDQDPERAAMSTISGKTDAELDHLPPVQLAQLTTTAALFPDDLVDSELGLIPKGWEVESIKDWGAVICGKTPPKKNPSFYGGSVPFIKIPDMHGNVFATTTNDTLSQKGASTQPKKQIPEGSICVSCIATVGQVVIASEDSHTNQQINSIVPAKMSYNYYLFFSMKERTGLLHEMASGGSATLNLNTGNFLKILLLVPSSSLLDEYCQKVDSIFWNILLNDQQSQVLSNIRDTLIPKLLSGEISVGKAKTTNEEMAV
jgi:type I restriction enzyme S subunit